MFSYIQVRIDDIPHSHIHSYIHTSTHNNRTQPNLGTKTTDTFTETEKYTSLKTSITKISG